MVSRIRKAMDNGPADTVGAGVPGAQKRDKIPKTIQSVERALDILEILAEADSEMALNELASGAHLNTSTCHHLLATLVKRGYAGQTSRTRNYFLGPQITELSDSRLKQFNLLDIAMPELRRLNEKTLESVLASLGLHGHDCGAHTAFQLRERLVTRVGAR